MKTAPEGYVEIEKYKQLESDFFYLKDELAQLKRMIFGAKSERFIPSEIDSSQLKLHFGEIQEEEAPKAEQKDVKFVTSPKKKKEKPVRALLPEHLERVTQIIEPESIPEGSVRIGEKITEILEYKPGRIYVRQIIRPKYALPDQQGVMNAELPVLPLPKANAGASLLSYIIVSKYVDHLPFYRIVRMFKRDGLSMAESTINGWFTETCNLLEPLYNSLKETLLNSDYIQADETPMPVLSADKKGSTHKGYFWVYHSPWDSVVIFDYQKSRSSEEPLKMLKDYKGTLQSDGYVAYENFANDPNVNLLACMAHARRYFEKALNSYKDLAEFAMLKIQELYHIEKIARENELSFEEIEKIRTEKSIPILNELYKWLIEKQPLLLPKSPIARAVNYTLNFWTRLKAYTQNGKYIIDNNLIENKIRPVAIGRKNYLFAGSHNAAQRAAMMYSLLGTCKIHDVNPQVWLTHVLNIIPDYKANKLYELFPQNFKMLDK